MIDQLAIFIAGFSATFLAGLIHGLTGFGFALVAVPIMIIFISPKIVVPVVLIYSILVSIIIMIEARKWIRLKRIWPIMVAAIFGIPVGTYLLVVLDVSTLRMFIGAVIIPFAIALLTGFQKQIKNEKLALAPIGFTSGFLCASTTLSGPPVILFLLNQGVEKQTFRANLVVYFAMTNSAAIIAHAFAGIIVREVFNYTLWFLPTAILGTLVGIKLALKASEKVFRNVALVIIIIAGLLSIASGLGIL